MLKHSGRTVLHYCHCDVNIVCVWIGLVSLLILSVLWALGAVGVVRLWPDFFVNLRSDYKELNLGFWKLKMFGFTWRRGTPTASTTELLLHAGRWKTVFWCIISNKYSPTPSNTVDINPGGIFAWSTNQFGLNEQKCDWSLVGVKALCRIFLQRQRFPHTNIILLYLLLIYFTPIKDWLSACLSTHSSGCVLHCALLRGITAHC